MLSKDLLRSVVIPIPVKILIHSGTFVVSQVSASCIAFGDARRRGEHRIAGKGARRLAILSVRCVANETEACEK